MTPEQVKLIKHSFKIVLPIGGLVADLFYGLDHSFEARTGGLKGWLQLSSDNEVSL